MSIMNNDYTVELNKYGIRKGPLLVFRDIESYNMLWVHVSSISKKIKTETTHLLPNKKLPYPIPGQDADDKGWKFFDFATKVTWVATEIACFYKQKDILKYNIREVKSTNGSAYMLNCIYGKKRLQSYHVTYVDALIELMKFIGEHIVQNAR